MVCWNMDNDKHAVHVGFKDSNKSHNSINDDKNVNSTEAIFSESHLKDVDHAHEQSLLPGDVFCLDH